MTSRFAYGDVPAPAGYALDERFYRLAARLPAGRPRRVARAAGHVPDMLRYARAARAARTSCTSSGSPSPQVDAALLPRGRPARAHRPRRAAARAAPRAARGAGARCTGASTRSSCTPTPAGGGSSASSGLPAERVHVIPHGAFTHLRELPQERALAPELAGGARGRSCSSSACCAPTRGSTCCCEAWRGDGRRRAVGRGHAAHGHRAAARRRGRPGVRFVARFVADAELPALLPPRRPRRAALPRDRAVGRALHGARLRPPAAAQRRRRLPRDRRGTARPQLVPPGDPGALHDALRALLADPAARERAGRGARARRRAERFAGTRSPAGISSCTARWPRRRHEAGRGRPLGLGRPARLHAGRLPAAAAPRSPRARVARARRPLPEAPAPPSRACRSIVAAHDEAEVIARKVANALALDWPADRLEVIVACDGSPDATAQRARAAGADLVLELPRGGKVRAQDAAVERAGGELLAFSDANALWEPDALRALAARFADERVGYVCGQRALRRRRRHEPGGPLLALRDGVRALESRPALGHRGQRRDLRRAPRGLHARRPRHEPRPLVPLQPRQARLARGVRARRPGRPRRWCPRSRASSPASGG